MSLTSHNFVKIAYCLLAVVGLLLDLAQRFAEDGSTMAQFGLPEPQGIDTELDRERLRWNSAEELAKLNHYLAVSPNTAEMDVLYDELTHAIDIVETVFVYIQGSKSDTHVHVMFEILLLAGEAGTGKTTFAEKLCAYTRSESKIAVGCAATALAAQVCLTLLDLIIYNDLNSFFCAAGVQKRLLHNYARAV